MSHYMDSLYSVTPTYFKHIDQSVMIPDMELFMSRADPALIILHINITRLQVPIKVPWPSALFLN